MSEYLSTDPSAGQGSSGEYLSIDPYAGDQVPDKKKRSALDVIKDLGVSGIEGTKSTARSLGAAGNTYSGDIKDVEGYAASQKTAAANSPEAKRRLLADIDTRKKANPDAGLGTAIADVGGAVVDNPEGTAQFVVEQAPNTALTLGAGYLGAKAGAAGGLAVAPLLGPLAPLAPVVGGVAGFIGGMFLGSTALETGGKAIEKAEGGFTEAERGESIREGAVKGAVTTAVDAATLGAGGLVTKSLSKLAIKRGAQAEARVLADAGVDVSSRAAIEEALVDPVLRATAKAAGKTAAKAASTTGRRAATAGTLGAMETVGEGAGEYLGELAATGKADVHDAVLESVAGLSQSAPEAIYNIRTSSGNNLRSRGIVDAGLSPDVEPSADVPTPDRSFAVAPEPSAAEVALTTPKALTALDRVDEINTEDARFADRQAELNAPGAYGEAFDQERQELAGQRAALDEERALITATWPKAVAGTDTTFSTEAGVRLGARYALMEADDLQSSHDTNLRPNPVYPPDLQPRERDRAASEMQVSAITQKLDPARLGESADAANGAPIVGADGLVESGNARTIALKRIYQANGQKATDYRQHIAANAARFGITPESVASMRSPVLVRVRSTPVNRAEFARQANAATVAAMSPSEQARADAARMDDVDGLNPDDGGDFTSGASRDFVRRFMARLPGTEQAGMIDANGSLSQTGYSRIRNAVLAKAYGDSPVLLRMVESLDDNMRNVSKAMMAAAPTVAKARQAIGEGALFDADIAPDLMAAVEELSHIKDAGVSVQDALAQVGMFGEPYSPETREMVQFLADNARSPRRIADFIAAYYQALNAAGNPAQGSLLGEATAPAKGDLLSAARRSQDVTAEPAGADVPGNIETGEEDRGQRGDAARDQGGAQGDAPNRAGEVAAANAELSAAWANLAEVTKPKPGTLNSGFDPVPAAVALVRLFKAAYKAGTVNARAAARYVMAQIKSDAQYKHLRGTIDEAMLTSAARVALDEFERDGSESLQQGLFDNVPTGKQGGLFDSLPEAKPKTVMIDGRPYDMGRDNFKPPATDTFVPPEILARARDLIARLRKPSADAGVSDAERGRAEALLAPLIERAKQEKAEHDQKIIDITKRTGALGQMLAPVKSIESATRKLVLEVGFDTGRMYDMLRSTIVVSRYADAQDVLDAIRERFEVVQGRIKNMTDAEIDGAKGAFIASGYGQILLNVKTPTGLVAEIQINVPEMLSVKSAEGHALYEIERAKKDGSQAKSDAIAVQRELYPLAAAAALDRADTAAARSDASVEPLEPNDTGKSRAGVKYNNPVSSSSPNTLPSGNLTNSVPSPLVPNVQPARNLSGTFIGSTSTASIADGAPQEPELLRKARAFATKFHKGQKRKFTGEDYINHPAGLVRLLRGVPHTDAMLAAAWLHDTVEDTNATFADVRAQFGVDVMNLVKELTRVDVGPESRADKQAATLKQLADASASAQTVKLADIIHNTQNLREVGPLFADTYLGEKAKVLDVLTKGDPTLMKVARGIVTGDKSAYDEYINQIGSDHVDGKRGDAGDEGPVSRAVPATDAERGTDGVRPRAGGTDRPGSDIDGDGDSQATRVRRGDEVGPDEGGGDTQYGEVDGARDGAGRNAGIPAGRDIPPNGTETAIDDGTRLSVADQTPVFFSQLARSIESASDKVFSSGAQVGQWLAANKAKLGLKDDEIQWSGINDYLTLRGKDKVTKAEVLDYLRGNSVKVEDVVKGWRYRVSLTSGHEYFDTQEEAESRLSEDREWIDMYSANVASEEGGDGSGYVRMDDSEGNTVLFIGENEDSDWVLTERWNSKLSEVEQEPFDSYDDALAFAEGEAEKARDEYRDQLSEPELEDGNTKFSGYWSDSYPNGIEGTYREILVTFPANGKGRGISAPASFAAQDQPLEYLGFNPQPRTAETTNSLEQTKLKVSTPFVSSHWEEPNVLVHVRLDEVMGADGKRYVRVGEVQSDWGQEGKKKGFGDGEPSADEIADEIEVMKEEGFVAERTTINPAKPSADPDNQGIRVFHGPTRYSSWLQGVTMKTEGEAFARFATARLKERLRGQVPAAPFVTDTKAWVSLGIKRAIKHAVDVGADGVVFGTGQQNADLYSLSKQVDSVEIRRAEVGDAYYVAAKRDGMNVIERDDVSGLAGIEDIVGKELAKKAEGLVPGGRETYSGIDLRVGGEGMKTFYDSIVPSVANDVLKKLGGGKVGPVEVGGNETTGDDAYEVVLANGKVIATRPTRKQAEATAASFDGASIRSLMIPGTQPGFSITDAMNEAIAGGLPLFSRKARSGMPVADVQAVADRIAAKMENLPPVHVFESPLADGIPLRLRSYIVKQGAEKTVEGAMHDGAIYLFASGLKDEARAEFVLAEHEVTHYGLRAILGNELTRTMQQIWNTNPRVRRAGSKFKGLSQAIAAEEVLADMTVEELTGLNGWRALVGRIRDWLREHGFTALADWMTARLDGDTSQQAQADAFAADLVRRARAAVAGNPKSAVRSLAVDASGQEAWLMREAKARGFKDIDDLAEKAYPVFEKLATKWRELHPADVMLSRGDPSDMRSTGLDKASGKVVADFKNDMPLKAHGDYKAAKAGDVDAAARLVQSLVKPTSIEAAKQAFGDDAIYVPVHAEEASGRNQIPNMLAHWYSDQTGGTVGLGVTQSNRAYHTGANAMERLLARAQFTGKVEAGKRYVLVDDVTTMGSTLADLANHIRSQGGEVVGSVLLVNATRSGKMIPDRKTVKELEARHGNEISKLFGIDTGALTWSEAQYLLGFRTTDELRNRVAKAESERSLRLRAKGVLPESTDSLGEVTPRLSRGNATDQTAAERADAILSSPAISWAPIDAAIKAGVMVVGLDRVTRALYRKAGFLLDRYTPETIKAGVVADYGIPGAVIDQRAIMQGRTNVQLRKTGQMIEKLATLTRAESRVAYEWLNNDDPQAADYFEQQLPPESVAVLSDVRKMIDQLSHEAVRLGQLDAETFKKNRYAYLRRSYIKHTVELTKHEAASRQRAIAVMGDQYKSRGMTDGVDMAKVQNVAPDWWQRKLQAGKADKGLRGEKFIRLERRTHTGDGTVPMDGMGDRGPGRLREVAYWPAGEPVAAKYKDWAEAGTWEVRGTKGATLVMWRDFTKQERETMGEIDEARFAIAKTLHGMVQDVETGRYLQWLADRYGKIDGDTVDGAIVEASERMRDTFKVGEWVRVPDTKISGTNVLRYGKLAGRYLPGPIWNDVRQIAGGRYQPLGETYAAIQRAWKTSKTALSPGVHTNNVMANFVMADWHDVGAGHITKALRLILAVSERDGKGLIGRAGNVAARAGRADREAAVEVVNRFRDSGGTIGTWATTELQKEQLRPLIEALEKDIGINGETTGTQVGVMVALQKLLHLQLPSAWDAFKPTLAGKAISTEARNLMDLYEAEDQVFRLAAWLKAKESGVGDREAGKAARRSFLDYHINAPWVQMMRQTALPFVAFTYRAVPMLLDTAANKPWKVIKLGLVAGAINAMGYAMLGLGGDDEDDERRLLPDEKAGRVWGMVPKLIRMPWNDANDSPVFLDVRRWVPVGDVVDTGSTNAAVPLPPALVPGGPLALMAEVALNKVGFTGKPITLETDTAAEKAGKMADYLYKAFAPNIIILPGTYAWTGAMNASTGKTDAFGREQSTPAAVASAFGVKLGGYPRDVLQRNAQAAARAKIAEINTTVSRLKREYQQNGIDKAEFREKIEAQRQKQIRVMEELREKL